MIDVVVTVEVEGRMTINDQPNDRRTSLVNLYQELLDAVAYVRQAIAEGDSAVRQSTYEGCVEAIQRIFRDVQTTQSLASRKTVSSSAGTRGVFTDNGMSLIAKRIEDA